MKALYDARGHDSETRRKNTAKSLISPGERPQEIHTPRCILTAIRGMWPSIALDPCGSPDSIVYADTTYCISPSIVRAPSGKVKILYIPGTPNEIDGLAAPWMDYTYCNPPFQLLRVWLAKALDEAFSGGKEILMLVPARTNRKWFRAATRTCSSICELDPVTFEGFGQSFPAPLWMLYWGTLTNLFEFEFDQVLGGVR
jgi:hypothetical protein